MGGLLYHAKRHILFKIDDFDGKVLVELEIFVVVVVVLVFGKRVLVTQHYLSYILYHGIDFVKVANRGVVLCQRPEVLRINTQVEYL